MRRHQPAWVTTLIVAAATFIAGTTATSQALPTELSWIGLYKRDLLDWLENINRLTDLCGSASPPTRAFEECRAEKLASKTTDVPLFRDARADAPSAGALRLLAAPGVEPPLRASFVPADGGVPIPFTPDLYDPDYGYGPYFHETILERRGSWFRLPEQPFPKGTWLNAADLGSPPDVKRLEPGDMVASRRGDLFVLSVEPATLRARPEQPADMWCEDPNPPPLKRFTAIQIPFRELFSPTGHLLLRIKYTRGC